MKWHPASMMLLVWAACFALFFLLPFQLVGRELSSGGLAMLGGSILAFCIGAWLRSPVIAQQRPAGHVMPDFRRADMVLTIAALVGMLMLFIEWRSAGGGLSDAWDVRSDRTTALLTGSESGSSAAFQIGFLFAPAGYVVIARELLFNVRVRLVRMLTLGFGPLLLSALALGGRNPLLWGFTVAALSFLAKRWVLMPPAPARRREWSPRALFLGLGSVIAGLMALNYFVQVFVIRAEAAGGIETVFDTVADTWGVTFAGIRAEILKNTIGVGNTYLVFVFAWYIVQGIVISNTLFTDYVGPPQLGLYGIELLAALVRRFNGDIIARNNTALFDLNVFGFLPSAFGTLYVDYWYFGLVVAAIWGSVSALVYRRVRTSSDARWVLVAPFAMQGILVSPINTPLGATNGFVTLSWMIVTFVLAKPRHAAQPARRSYG